MVAATLALAPYAGWIYGAGALGLGGWFLVEAHRLHARVVRAGGDPGVRPLPMRLFHLSITYLTPPFSRGAAGRQAHVLEVGEPVQGPLQVGGPDPGSPAFSVRSVSVSVLSPSAGRRAGSGDELIAGGLRAGDRSWALEEHHQHVRLRFGCRCGGGDLSGVLAALQRSGHGLDECLERRGHDGSGLLVTGD
jgi:hypothetical protein